MRKITMIIVAGIVMFSCNTTGTDSKEVTKDSTAGTSAPAAKMNYPYTIDHPDNWDIGSTENTMAALSGLKAYENGNVAECVKYFGDSVHLQFDEMDTKVSNDSLKAMFTKTRANLKTLDIKMYDWESVISKDKKAAYVTLWYKESWETMSGKKDSVSVVDDLKFEGGKIIEISETSRKFPAKKM